MRKIKLAVIFGGMPTEHDVSIVSGASVLNNLDKEKYEIFPIYIDAQGIWNKYVGNIKTLSTLHVGDKIDNIEKIENPMEYLKKCDIAFPVLHGLYGEDGTIQGLLELLKIRYVGCKVLASSLAMDKAYTKMVFEKAGLFNENLGRTEDNEMHYRIRKAGYKICFNPDIISYQNIRNSWCGMLKQKYGNGHWIGLTLGVCPGCFSIHHFVPLAFVFALILTGIIALLGNTGMLVCLCILYVIVDLLMSVLAVQRQKWYNYYLMLPLIFLSLHLAYGVGTLIGIIEMPFWVRKIKRDKNE